jgi:hypothetical protein
MVDTYIGGPMANSTLGVDDNEIRTKAYELWMQRGCPNGSPEEDWNQAERMLRDQAQQQSAVAVQATSNTVAQRSERTAANGRAKRRGD